jgi:hypothetical protein
VICDIDTLELPVLVTVIVCAADDVPVVTLPKLKLVGLMPRVSVAAMPVPLRLTEVGELAALLTIERVPDAVPTDAGRKVTVTVACWPAFTLRGKEKPLTLKAEPDALIWLMFRVAVPLLVITSTWDKLVPTTELPKLIEVELTWIAGAFTVSVAAELVVVPAVLLTATVKVAPLSAVVVAGVV